MGGYFPSVFMSFNKKQSASAVPPQCCNTNLPCFFHCHGPYKIMTTFSAKLIF